MVDVLGALPPKHGLPGGSFEGQAVLDVFAGSGALGLEALSRGAACCTFVEHERAALQALRENCARLGLILARPNGGMGGGGAATAPPPGDAGGERCCRVLAGDARRVLRNDARRASRYTLVFADPPYDRYTALEAALARLLGPLLAPRAVLVVETAATTAVALPWPVIRVKRYGDTQVTFLAYEGPGPTEGAARVDDEPSREPTAGSLMPRNVTAICPGTFDPVTVGHLDIVKRGACKFGRVVVGLIEVPQRKSPLFTPDEREAFLKTALADYDNVVVDRFNELVVEFAPALGCARDPQGPARHLRLRVRVRHGPAQ
jgi:16S rRNA (guanine(966)-N(2))-methyltransferase RsmD